MKVITIYEENHGYIATATTMKAALQYLIKYDWLIPDFEFIDDVTDDWISIEAYFEREGIELTKTNILAWAMGHANEAMFWDGGFYFYESVVCEEEEWVC